MARYDQFVPQVQYTFTTYAPALFGTFEGVTANGIVDHRMANNYIDTAAYHANIYGALPPGEVVNDHTKYSYLVVTLPNGTQTALGLPWIVEDSVIVRGRDIWTFDVVDVTETDIAEIARLLRARGYTIANPRQV